MTHELGAHSLSLAVKDIKKSFEFYHLLGFEPLPGAGSIEEKWMILQRGEYKIGLFQDMFEENIITFNPTDARSIYKHLTENGVEMLMESPTVQSEESGPCHFALADPDGNQILFDQF